MPPPTEYSRSGTIGAKTEIGGADPFIYYHRERRQRPPREDGGVGRASGPSQPLAPFPEDLSRLMVTGVELIKTTGDLIMEGLEDAKHRAALDAVLAAFFGEDGEENRRSLREMVVEDLSGCLFRRTSRRTTKRNDYSLSLISASPRIGRSDRIHIQSKYRQAHPHVQ